MRFFDVMGWFQRQQIINRMNELNRQTYLNGLSPDERAIAQCKTEKEARETAFNLQCNQIDDDNVRGEYILNFVDTEFARTRDQYDFLAAASSILLSVAATIIAYNFSLIYSLFCYCALLVINVFCYYQRNEHADDHQKIRFTRYIMIYGFAIPSFITLLLIIIKATLSR